MKQTTPSFPFPFESEQFAYTNNLKPLDPPLCIQITPEYQDELTLKRQLLRDHPERCYHSLADTLEAQWEVVELLTHQLVKYYPEHFSLEKQGDLWTFSNHLFQERTQFRFQDPNSLPVDPLDFIGRQVQEDLIIMSQRDGDLFLDAGQLCFPGNWSLTFDLGMPFLQIHDPVPVIMENGLVNRILRFLLRIETGKPWTRLNWSLNAGYRLDTSPETFDQWGSMRLQITPEKVPTEVFLRVEEQNLFRLPRSNSLLFSIHSYLLSIGEVVKHPTWARQLRGVLSTLPDEIANYKGIAAYKEDVLSYLDAFLEANWKREEGEEVAEEHQS